MLAELARGQPPTVALAASANRMACFAVSAARQFSPPDPLWPPPPPTPPPPQQQQFNLLAAAWPAPGGGVRPAAGGQIPPSANAYGGITAAWPFWPSSGSGAIGQSWPAAGPVIQPQCSACGWMAGPLIFSGLSDGSGVGGGGAERNIAWARGGAVAAGLDHLGGRSAGGCGGGGIRQRYAGSALNLGAIGRGDARAAAAAAGPFAFQSRPRSGAAAWRPAPGQ
jgi:hypothetical protein